MSYTIVGFDAETYEEPKPVRVESYYDRHTRSWITMLVDETGAQVGDAAFDGDKTGRDASIRQAEKQL